VKLPGSTKKTGGCGWDTGGELEIRGTREEQVDEVGFLPVGTFKKNRNHQLWRATLKGGGGDR